MGKSKNSMTFREALIKADEIHKSLEQKRDEARKAEAEYWKDVFESSGLEHILANADSDIDLFEAMRDHLQLMSDVAFSNNENHPSREKSLVASILFISVDLIDNLLTKLLASESK